MSWLLTFLFFCVFIIFIGFILRGIDRAWWGTPASTVRRPQSGTTPRTRGTDGILPAAFLGSTALGMRAMSEDDRSTDNGSLFSEHDDLLTNPVYAHLPGNIHHSLDNISGIGTGIATGPDYIHDPVYSFMPMNIYHTDATAFESGSSFDNCTSSISSFDNDWCSSSSSFDDWSSGSSSFDDW